MCGRFVIASSPEALRRLLGYEDIPNFPPRYNVAPTQPVPVVIAERDARRFTLMRWGLLPSWVKDPRKFALLINARTEGIMEKPAFKTAMRRRRCLIPADGWYEWQEQVQRKRPFFVYPASGAPIAFAALAETWSGPNGEELDTVAIITAAASRDLAALHPRAPVTIAEDYFEQWLDCSSESADELERALSLLLPPSEGQFAWHEVSTDVNRVANDYPELTNPASASASDSKDRPATVRPRVRQKPAADDGQGSLF